MKAWILSHVYSSQSRAWHARREVDVVHLLPWSFWRQDYLPLSFVIHIRCAQIMHPETNGLNGSFNIQNRNMELYTPPRKTNMSPENWRLEDDILGWPTIRGLLLLGNPAEFWDLRKMASNDFFQLSVPRIHKIKFISHLPRELGIQEISNGRTHGPRTPKKPEYLIALLQLP